MPVKSAKFLEIIVLVAGLYETGWNDKTPFKCMVDDWRKGMRANTKISLISYQDLFEKHNELHENNAQTKRGGLPAQAREATAFV